MCKWCKAGGLLLLALFVVAVSRPQSQAQGPAFETISIKPAPSGSPRDLRIRVLPNGDFTVRAAPVSMIISYAYDLPILPSQSMARLFEPRPWPGRFDIEAKASAKAVPAGLSASERQDRVRHMVRALLADRFKLVMRVEQKTMLVYALTVAKGGPKFKKSAIAEKECIFDFPISGSCHGFADGRGHPLTASAITMDDLALYIGNWADLPVVNRTALSGLFALESDGWRPLRLPPRSAEFPKVPNFDDLPTIFTVLGKLGLELNRQDATLPIYTVESMELPAAQREARPRSDEIEAARGASSVSARSPFPEGQLDPDAPSVGHPPQQRLARVRADDERGVRGGGVWIPIRMEAAAVDGPRWRIRARSGLAESAVSTMFMAVPRNASTVC